jgi:nucleoside phosphorylase
MRKASYTTFIYAALPCEAKPLVDHFKLKKDLSIKVFTVYCQDGMCLTVTGIGKNAMAAAVAYTQALFAGDAPCVLLNIGIAGHKDYVVGQLCLVDKISDVDSGKNYYPPLVFNTSCCTAPIQTVSKPVFVYDDACLCDMEASAFYETAMRFSTAELIQCLKVVSDNPTSPVDNIDPQQVSRLIAAHIPAIGTVLAELQQLAKVISTPESTLFAQWLERYRFTASERMQLKNQLCRWRVLTNNQALDVSGIPLGTGKDVLQWLEQKITQLAFGL